MGRGPKPSVLTAWFSPTLNTFSVSSLGRVGCGHVRPLPSCLSKEFPSQQERLCPASTAKGVAERTLGRFPDSQGGYRPRSVSPGGFPGPGVAPGVWFFLPATISSSPPGYTYQLVSPQFPAVTPQPRSPFGVADKLQTRRGPDIPT